MNANEGPSSPQEQHRIEETSVVNEHPYSIRDQDPDFRDAIDVTELAQHALFPMFPPKKIEKDQSVKPIDD